jgi:hypothetical protein
MNMKEDIEFTIFLFELFLIIPFMILFLMVYSLEKKDLKELVNP